MTAIINSFTGRRRQISILLTIAAVLLWAHSLLFTRHEIGHLGLICSLPVTFFIALALVTIASAILWMSKEKHPQLLSIQLLLLISALWLIPVVTGGSPPFINRIYFNLGLIDHIAGGGSFSSAELWYLSWPGAHIVFAILKVVGSTGFEPLIRVLPMFFILAFLFPLYIFLDNVLPEEKPNYRWAGLWLFCLGFWGAGGTSSSGQQVAFFLLLLVLALVTYPSLWGKGQPRPAALFTLGLLSVAIIPTHQLTSLALVLLLAAFSIARRTIKLVPIIALCLVMMVVWDITGGGGIITSKIIPRPLWSPTAEAPSPGAEAPGPAAEPPIPIREHPTSIITLDPRTIAHTEITGHFRGSSSHIAVTKVRILHSGIFALIGIAGAVFALFLRRKRAAPAIFAMALAPLLLLPISGNYGEEILQRLYLFCLPFMAYFGAVFLEAKSKIPLLILCLLLIAAIPTRVIAQYGNEILDYLPGGRVATQEFFDNTTSHGYVSGGLPLGYTRNLPHYKYLEYWELAWQENRLYTANEEQMPYYVAISNRDRAWYGWFWGNEQYVGEIEHRLDSAVNCKLTYSNPFIKLYESDGTELE